MHTTAANSPRKKGFLVVMALLLAIAMLGYVIFNWKNATKAPWSLSLEGTSFSYVTRSADNGNYYAIDSGGIRIIAFTQDGEYLWDTSSDSALRALQAAPDGMLYATSYDFADDNRIVRMSVEQYNKNGWHEATIYEETFEGDARPVYNAGMLSFAYHDGAFYFVKKDADAFTLCRLQTNGTVEELKHYAYAQAGKLLLSFAIQPETQEVYFADKLGGVFLAAENGTHEPLPYPMPTEEAPLLIPYAMATLNSALYISDIGSREIYKYENSAFTTAARMDDVELTVEYCALVYWLTDLSNGALGLITRGFSMQLSEDGAVEILPVEFSYSPLTRANLWGWWICAALLTIALLIAGAAALVRAYHTMGLEKLTTNLLLVVVIAVVTVLVMTRYNASTNERYTSLTVDQLTGLAALTAELIDGDELETIDSLQDYQTEAYAHLEKTLAPVTGSGQIDRRIYADQLTEEDDIMGEKTVHEAAWDTGVYRAVLRLIDGRMCYVYTSEDQYGALYPMDYPYEGTEFQPAYEMGQVFSFINVVDYSGEYTYTNVPITNSAGHVVGVLEMGIDQRALRQESKALMREIAISVVVVVLVVMLLIKEIMFFVHVLQKRVPRHSTAKLDVDACRPLIFLCYLLDCFALVISPLYARELYTATLGIPMEVGVAIATSMTFLFIGVAALIGGKLGRKIGLVPLMVTGTLLILCAEALAALSVNLLMFVISKAILGFGAGLLLNASDTFIAMQASEEDVERGFSMSNVGLNAGTNCGIIIGGAIATAMGYRFVYWAGMAVGVLLLGYILLMFRNRNLPAVVSDDQDKAHGSALRFLLSHRVWSFFLCMAVPYLICNAFVYYFLPLEGSNIGMSDETISRLMFVYAMVSIYVGPALTNFLVSRIKTRATLIVGGVLVAAALALYAFIPSTQMLLVGILAFAVADSFCMPVQNVYYSQLPETQRYGSGSALGISNIVNGLAQAASHYCFAAAMIFGAQKGITIIAGVFAVLLILFMAFSAGKKTAK